MMKKQMRLEKKLVALSIFALAIGLALALPLTYFTPVVGVNAQGINPWFNPDVTYAYINLHNTGDGVPIQGVVNFTYSSAAMDLKGANAQIEFYKFHIYSDKGSIANISYSIAITGRVNDPWSPTGFNYVINGTRDNIFYFADGSSYDANAVIGDSEYGSGIVICNNMPDFPLDSTYMPAVLLSCITDSETIDNMKNAQTLYIDVIRTFSVSHKGDYTGSTTTTNLTDDEVLFTVEMTKIDNGFVYGNYVEGTVPFPMQVPPSMLTLPSITPVLKTNSIIQKSIA